MIDFRCSQIVSILVQRQKKSFCKKRIKIVFLIWIDLLLEKWQKCTDVYEFVEWKLFFYYSIIFKWPVVMSLGEWVFHFGDKCLTWTECISKLPWLGLFINMSPHVYSPYFKAVLLNFTLNPLGVIVCNPFIITGFITVLISNKFGWILWHINLYRLFNAKSILIQIIIIIIIMSGW